MATGYVLQTLGLTILIQMLGDDYEFGPVGL